MADKWVHADLLGCSGGVRPCHGFTWTPGQRRFSEVSLPSFFWVRNFSSGRAPPCSLRQQLHQCSACRHAVDAYKRAANSFRRTALRRQVIQAPVLQEAPQQLRSRLNPLPNQTPAEQWRPGGKISDAEPKSRQAGIEARIARLGLPACRG